MHRLKYVYEYEWDVLNIASGIYIYMVNAEKKNENTIKIIGEITIIK